MSSLRSIHLAYDATLHGDWVARYALSLASTLPERRLEAVHVRALHPESDGLDARLDWLGRLGRSQGVEVKTEVLERSGVAEAIERHVPRGAAHLLVCGTRTRDRGQGLLGGTPSERWLREGARQVLALRVLDPGSLGAPERVLVPLASHPRAVGRLIDVLALFAPHCHELALYRAIDLSSHAARHLGAERARQLVEDALARLDAERAWLEEHLPPQRPRLEVRAEVSYDWPRSVLVTAARTRARLVLLGATERSLARRLLLGHPTERLLREAVTDVGVHRAAREP